MPFGVEERDALVSNIGLRKCPSLAINSLACSVEC